MCKVWPVQISSSPIKSNRRKHIWRSRRRSIYTSANPILTNSPPPPINIKVAVSGRSPPPNKRYSVSVIIIIIPPPTLYLTHLYPKYFMVCTRHNKYCYRYLLLWNYCPLDLGGCCHKSQSPMDTWVNQATDLTLDTDWTLLTQHWPLESYRSWYFWN